MCAGFGLFLNGFHKLSIFSVELTTGHIKIAQYAYDSSNRLLVKQSI